MIREKFEKCAEEMLAFLPEEVRRGLIEGIAQILIM